MSCKIFETLEVYLTQYYEINLKRKLATLEISIQFFILEQVNVVVELLKKLSSIF